MPRIGDGAPAFEAASTQGRIRFPADFKGEWVLLFSHPGDFTPVCTSEFVLFAAAADEFAALNCRLLGLSVGTVSSHIAWLRSIRERIEYRGIVRPDIRFPLIADPTMEVARRYGMIHPGESDTATVRAVFFIDPRCVIRTILYYPPTLGRNFAELRRILVGLQTTDALGAALPGDWRPGDDIVVPSGATMEEADRRTDHPAEGVRCGDWYFCTRPLPEEELRKLLRKKRK